MKSGGHTHTHTHQEPYRAMESKMHNTAQTVFVFPAVYTCSTILSQMCVNNGCSLQDYWNSADSSPFNRLVARELYIEKFCDIFPVSLCVYSNNKVVPCIGSHPILKRSLSIVDKSVLRCTEFCGLHSHRNSSFFTSCYGNIINS